MQIESLIKRKDGTEVDIGDDNYHFKPDAMGRHVCEVTDESHIERFLSITEGYREVAVETPVETKPKGKVKDESPTA